MTDRSIPDVPLSELVLDALPDHVLASMEARDRWLTGLSPAGSVGLELLVTDIGSWRPGQTVTVAFAGGTPELRDDIAEATRPITEAANLVLDFGEPGAYRSWSASEGSDAHIRVSFDQRGYFSLVGTDSIDPGIGLPSAAVGGRPHQRSLNLGGFAVRRPVDWRGVVRHEFLHALGFHHEHQNMRGPCQAAFRWDDDTEYTPTQDENGTYVVDANGFRPGIYTFLSGAPNGWSRQRVDANLRSPDGTGLVAGPFDAASVMLYRFPPLFYRSHPSPCAPSGDGETLSEGDRRGLALLYPHDAVTVGEITARRSRLADDLEKGDVSGGGLESGSAGVSARARQTAALIRATLAADGH